MQIPQGVADEEAVRIFVEFTNSSSATKGKHVAVHVCTYVLNCICTCVLFMS